MKRDTEDIALRLKAIIETAIDGIITIDTQGRIETFNKAASHIFGYSPTEVQGKNVNILMPEPDSSAHDGYLERYHATKQARIIGIGREVRGRRKDGHLFPLRLAVSEVILYDRVIYTGIIHDLSEVAKAKSAIEKANQDLELKVEERTIDLEVTINKLLDSNRKLQESEQLLIESLAKERELNDLKTRFVSMASHEFRTPMSTILSSASLISRYINSDDHGNRLKHIDRIKSAVNNLTGILNDFLSLTKLEEGYISPQYVEVDLLALCQEVHGDLQGLLRGTQHISHQSTGQPKILKTDDRILKNILFNLISNAVKYSPPHGEIICRIEYLSDQVRIDILDQGIGIPEDEQKHLFSRFFRARNVESIQGTGLGLHIVREYLQLLRGEIRFTSQEHVGSTFTIQLPLK